MDGMSSAHSGGLPLAGRMLEKRWVACTKSRRGTGYTKWKWKSAVAVAARTDDGDAGGLGVDAASVVIVVAVGKSWCARRRKTVVAVAAAAAAIVVSPVENLGCAWIKKAIVAVAVAEGSGGGEGRTMSAKGEEYCDGRHPQRCGWCRV